MMRAPEEGEPLHAPLNILAAFPYLDAKMVARLQAAHALGARILIDSGAFTAHHAGTAIKLADYVATLRALPFACDYFVLDVVGDHVATAANLQRMRDAGMAPIPIFTITESYATLDTLFDGVPFVGIAGLTVGNPNALGYLKRVMRHVGARPVHWLGFSRANFVAHYRPRSLDVSSWESGARYGSARLYAGAGRFVSTSRRAFAVAPSLEVAALVRSYDVEPEEMGTDANWRGEYGLGRLMNARSYVRYFADLEKQFGTRGYLAVAASQMIPCLTRAAQLERRMLATCT